jgi:3,4-dihydroxy-2-butanone 4-phosphate synthase
MKGGGGFVCASGQSASDPQLQLQRNLCLVGLEQLVSPEFSKKRARTKKLVKHAVLVEQSKIETGCGDKDKAERIAEAAIRYSEWSAAQAKMRGDFQYIQNKKGC